MYKKPSTRRNHFNEADSYPKGIAYLLGIESSDEEIKENPELKEQTEQVLDMTIYTDKDRNDV